MRRYAAEAIGAFAVVFMGCGAALVAGPRIGDAGVALAFGLGLAVMMVALGPISGGHCNPAVTLASAIAGRIRAKDVAPYIAAQLGGGAAGAALVVAMANGRPGGTPLAAQTIANGYDRLSPGFYGASAAIIAEIALTALFTLVVLGTGRAGPRGGAVEGAGGPRSVARFGASPAAALAAGGAYALIHLVGLPVTKMGANPARSLGPALIAGGVAMEQVWMFVVMPFVGAALAAFVYRALFGAERAASAPVDAPRAG